MKNVHFKTGKAFADKSHYGKSRYFKFDTCDFPSVPQGEDNFTLFSSMGTNDDYIIRTDDENTCIYTLCMNTHLDYIGLEVFDIRDGIFEKNEEQSFFWQGEDLITNFGEDWYDYSLNELLEKAINF